MDVKKILSFDEPDKDTLGMILYNNIDQGGVVAITSYAWPKLIDDLIAWEKKSSHSKTVKCCECEIEVVIDTKNYHCKTCFNKKNKNVAICECGDHIELHGKRDYTYKNGKYYCVDCMEGLNETK